MTMSETISAVPEAKKRSVRAVLFSAWGIPLDEFEKAYKELEATPFPFKNFGFTTLRQCLESIPDVVRFDYSTEASRWILYAVADESFMSSFTRKKQRTNTKAGLPNKKNSRRSKGKESPVRSRGQNGSDQAELVLSHRKMFTILIKSKDHELDEEKIAVLVNSVAPYAEKNCLRRLRGNYLFFRFHDIQYATAVIKRLHKYVWQGIELTVKPAEEKIPLNGPRRIKSPPNNPPPSPLILELHTTPPTISSSTPSETREGPHKIKSLLINNLMPVPLMQLEPSPLTLKLPTTPPIISSTTTSETSTSEGGSLPPPLIEDDESEDESCEENGEVGGPPPLLDESDSEDWSEEDEESHGYILNEHSTNGGLKKSTECQTDQNHLKKWSPGRGRGVFQCR